MTLWEFLAPIIGGIAGIALGRVLFFDLPAWRRRRRWRHVHDYAGTSICQTHQSTDCPRIEAP